jgi:hypothetical protein
MATTRPPGEGGVVIVREPARPRARVRRLLTLDVHDEIDPATREWVTVDEAGHAFLDVDETHAQALGAAFETWLNGQKFHSDRLRLLHPVAYARRPETSRGSAVRRRMLLHSPVDSVDPPKVERIKMKALDAGETAAPCPLPRHPHVRAGPTGSHVRAPARRNHGVALGLCRSCPRAAFGSGKHGTDSQGNPVKGDKKWPPSHRGYSLMGHRGASLPPRSPSRGVVDTGRPAERSNLCCCSRGRPAFAAKQPNP